MYVCKAVYVPADDLTDPAPATTFAHLDATTVLSRQIAELGMYVCMGGRRCMYVWRGRRCMYVCTQLYMYGRCMYGKIYVGMYSAVYVGEDVCMG